MFDPFLEEYFVCTSAIGKIILLKENLEMKEKQKDALKLFKNLVKKFAGRGDNEHGIWCQIHLS